MQNLKTYQNPYFSPIRITFKLNKAPKKPHQAKSEQCKVNRTHNFMQTDCHNFEP